MNKRYLAVENEVFVYDENTKMTKRPYQEGIDEVLEQENIVEEIQNQIEYVTQKIADLGTVYTPKQAKKMAKKPIHQGVAGGLLLTTALLIILTVVEALDLRISILMQIQKRLVPFMLLMGVFAIPFDLIVGKCLGDLDEVNAEIACGEYNALNFQLNYLKEREKVEVAKLNKLKEDLAKQPIAETNKAIDKELDLTELKKLRSELDNIYEENYELPEIGDKQKTLN